MFNYSKPDWGPLERAIALVGLPVSQCGSFMWMCEEPQGVHQFKHCDTRNYAMLRSDSSVEECRSELRNAFYLGRTWGTALDARLGGTHAS